MPSIGSLGWVSTPMAAVCLPTMLVHSKSRLSSRVMPCLDRQAIVHVQTGGSIIQSIMLRLPKRHFVTSTQSYSLCYVQGLKVLFQVELKSVHIFQLFGQSKFFFPSLFISPLFNFIHLNNNVCSSSCCYQGCSSCCPFHRQTLLCFGCSFL